MKKIILLVALIFSITMFSYSQSGWFNVSTPINNLFLNHIQFTSVNTGYAIGPLGNSDQGYLLKTTNGGSNWQSTYIDSLWSWSLYFVDNNTGFMVGDKSSSPGIIKKTTNGGINWVTCLIGLSNCYFSIYFVDYNTGYAGGKYDAVVKTTNGGLNWVSKPGAIGGVTFNDVYFFNANTGIVTGVRINKTTNGGDNWYICNDSDDDYMSIFFVNNSTGYVCSYSGKIFKTTDAGDNWFFIDSLRQGLNSIFFINPNTGFTCPGGYNILKTTDGGFNWIQHSISNLYHFNSVYFINNYTGFIAGDDGMIMKTTNGGNVFVNSITNNIPDKFSLYQNYPNPFNPTTKIKFDIGDFPLRRGVGGMTSLKIYDLIGKEIATLVNEQLNPGTYEVTFDARQPGLGSNLPSGVYFYQLRTDNFLQTKKLILLK